MASFGRMLPRKKPFWSLFWAPGKCIAQAAHDPASHPGWAGGKKYKKWEALRTDVEIVVWVIAYTTLKAQIQGEIKT